VQCLAAGEPEIARSLVSALPETEEGATPHVAARVLHARAMLFDFDGDVVAYGRSLDEAARCFERAGDLRNMCLLRVGVGAARLASGRGDKAEGAFREARAAALRLGLAEVVALSECGLARALAAGGRLDDARDMAQRALRAFANLGDGGMAAQSAAVIARVELLAARLDAARDAALEAVKGAGRQAPLRALALATLSAVRAARGEAAEALSAGRDAVAALQTLDGVTEDEGFILLAHAEALALVDRWDEARRAITAAWERLQQRASRFEDEAARRRFLETIPEHARTERLYVSWAADA
jgi:tetratricopeptide (TPR) repeat protein